jgi:hypothetical protein
LWNKLHPFKLIDEIDQSDEEAPVLTPFVERDDDPFGFSDDDPFALLPPSPAYGRSSQLGTRILPDENKELSGSKEENTPSPAVSNSGSDLPSVTELAEYSQLRRGLTTPAPTALAPTSSRPVREHKPTAKQASQQRHVIKKEQKKAKLVKKPKTTITSQLEEFQLPFRSS